MDHTTRRRLIGALVGGLVGFAVTWLAHLGNFSLLAAAGGGVAIGAGSRAVPRSLPWTIGITLLAMAFAVFTAWFFNPFKADPSLGYFLANLGSTNMPTKVSLAITAILGGLYGGGTGSATAHRYGDGD